MGQGDGLRDLVRPIPYIFDYGPDPQFDLVAQLRDFETAEQAEKRRKSLVRALKRHRPKEALLIGALSTCTEPNRCRLLCCPVCMRAMRRWACGQFAPIVAEAPERWTIVTLVPDRHRLDAGMLHRFNPQHLFDAIRKAVKRYGPPGTIVFGAVDFCEDMIGAPGWGLKRRVWCPHIQVMSNLSPEQWAVIRIKLKRYFTITAEVKNPIHVGAIQGSYLNLMKPISYCVKATYYSRFVNKFSGDAIDAADIHPGKGKPRRMHGAMLAELAVLMAQWRRKDRLLLIGLKGVKKSVVRTKPAGRSRCLKGSGV